MASDFGGLERDLARVRAVSDNFRALEVLRVNSPEADAERLYTKHAAARRAKLPEQAMAAIEELGKRFPKSRWRLRALISQANDYLVKNEVSQYEPIYRTCYQEFPSEPEAASCHWKVAWASYMRREGSAMFEEHLRLFPKSEKSALLCTSWVAVPSSFPGTRFLTIRRCREQIRNEANPRLTSSRDGTPGSTEARSRPRSSRYFPSGLRSNCNGPRKTKPIPTRPRWRSRKPHPGAAHTMSLSDTSRNSLRDISRFRWKPRPNDSGRLPSRCHIGRRSNRTAEPGAWTRTSSRP